jgi:hypothetical protein
MQREVDVDLDLDTDRGLQTVFNGMSPRRPV